MQKTIALVGNPNCGKTTIFNQITGAHQRVGNWGGVTVDITEGVVKKADNELTFVDLPGTYSLSAFSLEEKVARNYIVKESPDLVVNVIDATNLERNLYFTVQLLELGVKPLIVLNMWDEVQDKGISIDIERLSQLLGTKIITTIGKTGVGVDKILEYAENWKPQEKLIPFTPHLNKEIYTAYKEIVEDVKVVNNKGKFLPEWRAIKLLEKDPEVIERTRQFPGGEELLKKVDTVIEKLKEFNGEDPEMLISEARYGYATGVAKETVKINSIQNRVNISDKIDSILTHKIWAYPIFFFFLWLLFNVTFTLGAIPQAWITSLFDTFGVFAQKVIPEGWFQDLVVNGIIAGVGGVASFLPNILILFAGISIMEDTGYMARAAFIMDKFMHKLGLHGKSFIPMIMGLGCTVPAIMATRTLESPRDRIKTILLTPLISCGARTPIFILFAGALFPQNAGNIVFLFNIVFGFLAFAVMAILFKHTIFNKVEDVPFVMELPPYRLPTMKSILMHMWHNAEHYIVKMGTVVLFFSILLWFAGEYPKDHSTISKYETQITTIQNAQLPTDIIQDSVEVLTVDMNSKLQEGTYLGKMGKMVEPVVKPFGTDWRGAVALITGFVAKEVVVSSLGVLYATEDNNGLKHQLSKHFTKLSAFAFMWFVLLYTPCIVALTTIIKELNNWKWSLFSIIYQPTLAWLVATVVYQGGKLLGLG